MRVVILTSSRFSIASRCLPVLCQNPRIEVAAVILAKGHTANKKALRKRRIKKTFRIGIWGALNGVRMRKWYRDKNATDLLVSTKSSNMPLVETDVINSDNTRRIFREMQVDLGLSMGNGYIPRSVFSIPRFGMINIHMEILPAFQGAQSIIWPIYEGIDRTGLTIHQIDEKIDTGRILYQKEYPITFRPTLKETVEASLEMSRRQIPEAFSYVCDNYQELVEQSNEQPKGKSYSTPTIMQFVRIVRNHRAMFAKTAAFSK